MADQQARHAVAQQRVGQLIGGKFRLQRLLGAGGMAAVYEASHRNGKRVALKLLHPALCAVESQRKRLLREAHLANAIGHPGVVEIFDDGVDESGAVYLVLELLEGETVAQLQTRHGGELPLVQVIDIADQLLDVLTAAHARGIVHRDIKPDNLFIARDGRLRVLDFGIAQPYERIAGTTLDTESGATLGTPAFMAQEQARGRWSDVDQRTDLWAVGATLFTLVSGEHVHSADTVNEQLGRAMTLSARSLAKAADGLPESFVAVVDRALQFEPAARWPTARAMQAALREVVVPSAAATTLDSPRTPAAAAANASPKAARRFEGLGPVALLATLLAIVALVLAASMHAGVSLPTARSQPTPSSTDDSAHHHESGWNLVPPPSVQEPPHAISAPPPAAAVTQTAATPSMSTPPTVRAKLATQRAPRAVRATDPLDLRY